jgi:MFS family permease
VAFVVVEARVARPLVPLGFLRSRSRVSANVVSALVAGAMAGMFVLLTIYLQTVLHWSPLQTGVAYLPFCLAFAPGFGLSVLLVKRAGTRVALVTALGVCTVGMLLMARIGPAADYPGTLLPAMVVLAVGLGMAFPTAQNAALAGVSEGTTGLASGVQTTCQALGGALGVAVLVGIATGVAQGGADPGGATVHGDRVAFLVAAGAYAVAAVIAVVGVREAPDPSGALLPASADSHPE